MLNPFNLSAPNEIIAERYELTERLGTDGAKQVFLAHDLYSPGHKTQCVVERFIFPVKNTSQMQAIRHLFHAEAKHLSQLGEDTRVPKLLAYFEKAGTFYRVREWIEGRPLERILTASTPLSDSQVVLLLGDLLTTVAYIHQHDVLHLNLQPANLVCERGNHRLVATNFGGFPQRSARVIVPELRLNAPPIFDLSAYMAPEQLAGHPCCSSDLYAVGMMGIRALNSYPSKTPIIDTETKAVRWPAFTSVRHPALLSLLQDLVRYDFRDRYQSAAEACCALRALPDDLTQLMFVSSIFPQAGYVLDAAGEPASKSAQENKDSPVKKLVPMGVGAVALMGASALIWRAVDPITVIENSNRVSAVSESTAEESTAEESTAEEPFAEEPSVEHASAAPAQVDMAEIDSGELSSAPTNLETADVERVEVAQVEESMAAVASRQSPPDERVVESAAAVALNEAAAKATISRFYDRVASRSWGEVRSLLNDRLARSLEPNFFYQFSKVSVDDFRIVNESPDAIDIVVENTYVYLDGTSQREERSYTVEIVDNQPTITATAFEEVIKDRS